MEAQLAQGIAALNAGDLGSAERLLLGLVERDSRAHQAWHALSVVAVRMGMPQVAIERARRAISLARNNASYLNSLGIAHAENEDWTAAEQAFRRALKIDPASAQGHYNLGKALREQGRLVDAVREYARAHALSPNSVAMQLGLATIYRLSGQPERALGILRAAVGEGIPDSDLIPYLSECLADLEGPESAIAWLRSLLDKDPQCQQAHHVLGVLLLSLGQLREGWPHYLWRAHWDARRARERPSLLPESLGGKRIFLRAEEGIGDVLFVLRLLPELRARGATVALEDSRGFAKLAPLVADRIELDHQKPTDVAVWLNDVPALLDKADMPAAFELHVDEHRRHTVRGRLAALGPRPYLGLTWRAGTDARRAREIGAEQAGLRMLHKELPPATFGAAFAGWRGTIVSLQRGAKPGELETVGRTAKAPIHDLSSLTDSLEDALALLAELDEYAGVINTNMHLLAGIGRGARVLAPRPLDWRWLRLEGASPWFPGFHVYRQPVSYDWSTAFARLREDLFQ